MAGTLQGDQRALLQLLYERGQSYEDIAGLLGVSPGEVRERARAALQVIGGADPDSEVPLTDFMLGKADPIGRADAIRHLQSDPRALELAERIRAALVLLAPDAKAAKLPEPRGKARRAAIPITAPSQSTREEEQRAGAGGPSALPAPKARAASRSRLAAILVGVGIIAIVAILAVAGAFDGGDQAPPQASQTAGPDGGSGIAGDDSGEEITRVDLKPVDGSGTAGTAVFRLLDGQQLVVDLDVRGLDPTPPKKTAYLLWLIVGEQAAYPVSTPLQPDQNGSFENRIAIPTEIAVTFGSQASAVSVSQTPLPALRDEVDAAAEKEAPILSFVGTDLASGKIPLVREGGRRGAGKGAQGSDGG